jgi:phosphatidylserine/phosphatidylglycerophosphate/cardiolipin synthase-like enzyme
MKNNIIRLCALALSVLALSTSADARKKSEPLVDATVGAREEHQSISVPAAGTLEVAFSPNEGSEGLVLKVIDSAKRELRILSYSFTSAPVVAALLRAKRRGVDIRLVADKRNNVSEDRSGKARAALSALANAGIDVRLISTFALHHDKVIVADRQAVELGSYNYSDAAAHKNSENVLVNWGNAKLAEVYLRHFDRNYRQAIAFELPY